MPTTTNTSMSMTTAMTTKVTSIITTTGKRAAPAAMTTVTSITTMTMGRAAPADRNTTIITAMPRRCSTAGIVPDGEGGWLEFDFVPDEYEVRQSKADYTGRLCVIGVGLKEDKLAQLFGL